MYRDCLWPNSMAQSCLQHAVDEQLNQNDMEASRILNQIYDITYDNNLIHLQYISIFWKPFSIKINIKAAMYIFFLY